MSLQEGYVRKVIYDSQRWELLRRKRALALKLMKTLANCGMSGAVVHGSVARGDVEEDSDVDIAFLKPYPPGLVELCLEKGGYSIFSRVLVMATPIHTPKLYIYLDPREEQVVSIPLAELSSIEAEFYKFSGMLELRDLEKDLRVPGVNKRLMFIEPTSFGHIEIPVLGNEDYVAKRLGVSLAVVMDRVEALTKRAKEGHTGLFIEREIPPSIDVETYVRRLCSENKIFREKVQSYGLCI